LLERRRWETSVRYYEAIRTVDLFGEDILIKAWGGKFNRMGGVKVIAVGDESVRREILRIEKTRRRKGYVETSA